MLVHPASHKMAHNEPSTFIVDSSFWEDVKRAGGSSRNSKLVVSGNNALWSGRKNLLTCSSVLKAFTKARARKRVTRHEHVFIASRRQGKQQKFGGIASLWASLRWRRIFASLYFYNRYICIDNVWILSQRYQSYSLLSDFFKYETPLRIWY